MIIGIIHKGSGCGDQLFSYIATRVRAADLGVDFGFVGKEFFKGAGFMNLDWGKETNVIYNIQEFTGRLIIDDWRYDANEFVLDKPYYDPEFNFIPDGSVIDGYGAQDIRYFEHRLDEVREWLNTKDTFKRYYQEEDICVVNIRGGEYREVPDLFLPKQYWIKAMDLMKQKYPNVIFEIHSDDLELANSWFPDCKTFAGNYIDLNWVAMRYAKHLIISNSAFAILPALLNENVKEVIAPFGWNARNASLTKWEGRPGNYYKKFTYI